MYNFPLLHITPFLILPVCGLMIFCVLQILSSVLDMIPYAFGIRLAALASRKELVDLEKWLSNNLSTFKDIFYEVCFIHNL